MMSDTSNSIWHDDTAKVHRLSNRWVAAIAPGDAGTPKHNLNWWREVRGVRIATNPSLHSEPSAWTAWQCWGQTNSGGQSFGALDCDNLELEAVPQECKWVGGGGSWAVG